MNVMRYRLMAALVAAALAFASCDDGGDTTPNPHSGAGTVTLGAEEGIVFSTGVLQQPGNFGNSDLYATSNGTALKLSTGGANIVDVRLVTWFQTSGGVYPTYGDIDEVPNVKPQDTNVPLPKAATGNGFVLQNSAGGFTKGHVTAATATSVTIQYEPLP